MKPLVGAALGAAAGLLVARALTPRYSFRGKRVLITGGSKGLGLVMARRLVAEGARVALLARGEAALRSAVRELGRRGADAAGTTCDVRNEAEVVAALGAVSTRFGGLDVLINNAGVIQTGPFESADNRDFAEALATHLWGPLYTVRAALPHLEASGGRILNVASIGGLVSVPHLSSYSASKFALVGLSDALRAELKPKGVSVTTACPWLTRTGSHYNVQLKGQHAEEFTLFALASALPGSSVSAESTAKACLEALRSGRARVVTGTPGKAAHLLDSLAPEMSKAALELIAGLLPESAGAKERKTGWEVRSETPLVPSLLTRLAERAAARNNEFT